METKHHCQRSLSTCVHSMLFLTYSTHTNKTIKQTAERISELESLQNSEYPCKVAFDGSLLAQSFTLIETNVSLTVFI